MRRVVRVVRVVVVVGGLVVLSLAAWSVAIGPVAAWRVVTHGTTTVWDHLAYPGRDLEPASEPSPWPGPPAPLEPAPVVVDGASVTLEERLITSESLAFVVVRDGALTYEWYADGHDASIPSMLFSVTKSILSLLVGAAIDDGLIGGVDDPVTDYLPELADRGFDQVTLEQLLRMDSAVDYTESDNPFGEHVRFNYTDRLEEAILGLRVRDRPDEGFTYRSGDNALLGLVLARVLGERSISGYLQDRLREPLGMEHAARWSTDHEGGLERTWCCLATTARDLARVGQLVLDRGDWQGQQLIAEDWFDASVAPGFAPARWPAEYDGSPLANYGYQWWLTDHGATVSLGKDGQYLYVDRDHRTVIVRLGTSQGGASWVDTLRQVAAGQR
jgi:CubicO group peptidase (beta-lactamase class C family)